jgi:replicative DNA helicase
LDDPALKALVKRFIDAGQLGFTDPASAWAWRVIASTDTPTTLQLETEAGRIPADDPARGGIESIIRGADVREDEYVRGQVVEWARQQVFRLGFEEARSAWNTGRTDDAMHKMMARIEEMAAMRLDAADRGWFFEDFDARQTRREFTAAGLDHFPSGIDKIDKAMNGGLHYGELEVPLAYSGIGKTFWCVQRGFVCSRMRERCIHFVLEGGRGKTEDRYEARFTDTLYSQVRRGDFDERALAILRREYDILKANLVVRGFADRTAWRITFEDMLGELSELRRAHGWVPSLIVVDYGDLVHAEGEGVRERQMTAFRQLHALAERQEFRGHRGYAVCAPSQAQRPDDGADEREHVLRPHKIADCYEKVRVADAIVSINRTRSERERDRVRVHLGKYRDAQDGITVRVATGYAKGAFSVLGCEEDDVTSAGSPVAAGGDA